MTTNDIKGKANNTPPNQRHAPKSKPPKINNTKETVLRIWKYMSSDKHLFIIVIFLVFVGSALSLLGPYLLGKGVDILIEDFDQKTLIIMVSVLIGTYILHSIALWFQNYWMIAIAQTAVYKMREHLFSHLQRLPLPFFQKRQSGELMSRLTNDIENVSRTLNSSVIQLSTSILTLTGTIIVMVVLSPLLTLLTLTIVPAMFYGMKWITKRTRKYYKEQQRALGEMNGYIEETMAGHKIIKLFSQEQHVIDSFEHKNEDLRNVGYWAQVYSGFIPKLMNSLNNVSFTIIVGVGGLLAVNGFVSIGIIVTFTTYARQFIRPLNDLANQYNVILSAVAGAERVFQIIDEKEEEQYDDKQEEEAITGDIAFQSVSFSYEQEATLKDISFQVQPGQTVALVGPTGAGKTTIVSLLSRFFELEKGKILVDGKDIRSLSKAYLRKQMGVVLQDAYLFETTVRENIRDGRLDATDEAVVAAAQAANADEFIKKLPEGYDTVLQSDGSGISHGQRQLLSIARAMLANPALLILDEATSSIDTITEIKINEALTRLMKGRTSFVIAHRLHTIRRADVIIVLNHGEIIEKGTHQELLRQQGFYAQLVHAQSEKRHA